MQEITIVGAGLAGVNLVEKIREENNQIKITLLDKNPYHFVKKYITQLNLNNWFFLEKWAKEKRIDFIKGKVERISIKRKKIYLKENNFLEFNNLVLCTGLVSKKNFVKGTHLEGFFYLSEIDFFKLKDYLKVSSEITIYVSTILGLKMALRLHSLGKEIKILFPCLDFLGNYKQKLLMFLKEKGIIFYENANLEEIIGEGRIKAVRISPFKIFSSQMVIIDSGFLPNDEFFEEEVKVKEGFFTNFEGVYFLGDVNRQNEEIFFLFNYQETIEEAKVFADFILNKKKDSFFKKGEASMEDKEKMIEEMLHC
jgi:NAD(P)H-nitrite reductase large subunit